MLSELKNFISRPTPDFYEFLKKIFKQLKGIKLLLILGFFVKEDDSAVDLLIVADKTGAVKIKSKVNQLESQFGRELKYALLSLSEFNYRYSMFDKFLRDILGGPRKTIINKLKNFSWL